MKKTKKPKAKKKVIVKVKPKKVKMITKPKAITPEKLTILKMAFAVGATDVQACFLAEISDKTLYRYQDEHPGFSQYKKELKNMPQLKAKLVLMELMSNAKVDVKERMLRFALKKDPDFGDSEQGSGNILIQQNFNPRSMSDEELLQLTAKKE